MFGWTTKLFPLSKYPHCGADARGADHNAEAYKNLGNDHLAKGEFEQAILHYRRAISVAPNFAEAHNNLGFVLLRQGQIDQAIAHFRQALSIKPELIQAHLNCGNAHLHLGQIDEAVACFRAALALDQGLPEAHTNLGNIYKEQGKLNEAVASFRQAISFDPQHAEAHNNLGNLLMEQGLLEDALTSYRQVLHTNPERFEIHNNLGNIYKEQGKLDEAYACYREALRLNPDCAVAHSGLLMTAQYDARHSPSELYAEHLRFGERFDVKTSSTSPTHHRRSASSRRLRVGFVSGDFWNHPIGHFMENILAHLNRQTLDIELFSTYPKTDDLTLRLRNLGHTWFSLVGLSDDDTAKFIQNRAIDILVDLSGHTAHNRLLVFARKPSPVQISWLGYSDTTGMRAMDYLLCDRYVIPPDTPPNITEKPLRLPDSYLCFTPPPDDIPTGILPTFANGHVTFGSFNNLTKMNEVVVALWAQVLHAVPGSRLLLKARQLSVPSSRQQVMDRFASHKVASDRILLQGWSPSRHEALASYNQLDIALDPFPYNGTTTTVEALWMGVPVLVRRGNRFISRVGASILQSAGLPEWIAEDDTDYIAKATAHAVDLQRLAQLRSTLRTQFLASPLCDAARFARNLEAAFQDVWQTHSVTRSPTENRPQC